MGARTIDEGAMDEKSGMNFSEYMALLSGNTDLLDKAKLEKRIASLEGERKSFNKGKRDSEFKLESKTGELRNNTAFIEAMTEDWNRFLSIARTDKEGNRLNAVKVDGVDSTDEKVIGKRLQEIAKNATTGGLYKTVGELYGFPIKVVSERILKEGLEFTDNRFVVEGNYKYTYNNGHLAMADPIAAARNFLNAMERIPSIIDQYKSKNEVLEKEIPHLTARYSWSLLRLLRKSPKKRRTGRKSNRLRKEYETYRYSTRKQLRRYAVRQMNTASRGISLPSISLSDDRDYMRKMRIDRKV